MKRYLLPLVLIAVALVAACGNDDSGSSSEQTRSVIDAGVFTLADLEVVGFKKGKSFDVEGLDRADDAYYGFWGKDPYNRQEFEARFYPTHADAVEFGTEPAQNRVGRDAQLSSGLGLWEEGMKEARQCTRAAGGDSSDCTVSRYGDFVIYGNLVLLCQGRDSASSFETCNDLLDELKPTSAS